MENWIWGLGLIVLTILLHVIGAASIALLHENLWARHERPDDPFRHRFRRWMLMSVAVGLSLAGLHCLEIGLWAVTYWHLEAMTSFPDAIFFSIDSMTTRGASGLTLKQDWRILGALEAVDGMLLFGISTAFMFAMLLRYWEKLMTTDRS